MLKKCLQLPLLKSNAVRNYLNSGKAGIGTTLVLARRLLAPSAGGMLYTLSKCSTWSSSLDDPRSATNLQAETYATMKNTVLVGITS